MSSSAAASSPSPSSSSVSVWQPPAGYLGNLTEAQTTLLRQLEESEKETHEENLKRLTELDKERYRKKEGREATEAELVALRSGREEEWPHELLRFLRACKWDLATTQATYRDYLQFRVDWHVDTVLDSLPFNVELLRRCVGSHAVGFDKEGRPIYIEKSGHLHIDLLLTCATDEDVLNGHFFQQENSIQRCAEGAKRVGHRVETFTQIVDLEGLNMHHKAALKFTKALFEYDAKYYPERLGHLFVVNAPWVFNAIWAIVKGWIDPVTRSKITVCKQETMKDTLLQYIDAEMLPKEYGGTCSACPTSPDCVRRYTMDEIKPLLPMQPEEFLPLCTKETVRAGKNIYQRLEATKEGDCFEWFFLLPPGQDVDFSVTFERADGLKAIVVSAPCRVVTNEGFGAQGSYRAPVPGSLVLNWDNSFSYFSSKEVQIYVSKCDNRREMTGEPVKVASSAAASSSSSSSSSASSSAASAAPASDPSSTVSTSDVTVAASSSADSEADKV